MTVPDNEIGLCHHCRRPIWCLESYVQLAGGKDGEIEQYHPDCFRLVEWKWELPDP